MCEDVAGGRLFEFVFTLLLLIEVEYLQVFLTCAFDLAVLEVAVTNIWLSPSIFETD